MTANAYAAHTSLTDRNLVFIGGRWVESTGNAWVDVIDPWTEQTAARVRLATEDDIVRAVTAARESFNSGAWSGKTMDERADVVEEIGTRLASRVNELAPIGVVEVGLPIGVSAATLEQTFGLYAAVAAEARRFELIEERPRHDGGVSQITREPSGVVAAIIPWNGPISTLAFKAAPALVSGCSVVVKAAPDAPLSPAIFADVIAELVDEGRIPEGVVSVVVADRDVSETLVTNPDVDHITFTGSTAAGRRIAELAGKRIARVSLELGGKSAAIILDDADLDHVLQSLPMGSCMQSGQACIALTRVLVSEKRHDEVVGALKAAYSSLPMGNPWKQSAILGPLAGARHRDRVQQYIDDAVRHGATIVLGGGKPEGIEHGYFVAPTLIDGASNEMAIAQEEVFGPVVAVITYRDDDEAIAIANDSIYGLFGTIYTQDISHGTTVARRIQSGVVSINSVIIDFTLPFGGYKQSGLGREGGREGLAEFFEVKTIHLPSSTEPN